MSLDHTPFVFLVSAPSGAGKTTLLTSLLAADAGLRYSVSYTTRPAREGEVDGRDYYFVTDAMFRDLVGSGVMLESAYVHGHYYGTSVSVVRDVLASGFDVVLDVDVEGFGNVQSVSLDVVSVFILPPSMSELRRRLVSRGTETVKDLDIRLRAARKEIEWASRYDYIVVNDQVDTAVKKMESILSAERLKSGRVGSVVEKIKLDGLGS